MRSADSADVRKGHESAQHDTSTGSDGNDNASEASVDPIAEMQIRAVANMVEAEKAAATTARRQFRDYFESFEDELKAYEAQLPTDATEIYILHEHFRRTVWTDKLLILGQAMDEEDEKYQIARKRAMENVPSLKYLMPLSLEEMLDQQQLILQMQEKRVRDNLARWRSQTKILEDEDLVTRPASHRSEDNLNVARRQEESSRPSDSGSNVGGGAGPLWTNFIQLITNLTREGEERKRKGGGMWAKDRIPSARDTCSARRTSVTMESVKRARPMSSRDRRPASVPGLTAQTTASADGIVANMASSGTKHKQGAQVAESRKSLKGKIGESPSGARPPRDVLVVSKGKLKPSIKDMFLINVRPCVDVLKALVSCRKPVSLQLVILLSYPKHCA
jgi:hypothetical protein